MYKIFLILKWLYIFYVIDGVSTEFIVHFCKNGAGSGFPFLVTANDLTDGFQALKLRIHSEIPMVLIPQSHTEDWAEYKIYNESGRYLEFTQELIRYEENKLYLVPRNRYFVWPHVRPGHIVNATDRDTVNGTILLESLAASPRVFYIHNLFSKEEADILINRALTTTTGPNALIRSTTGAKPREERNMSDESSVDRERTSDNAWDQSSPESMRIIRRIFDVVRVPFAYDQADGLQLVRYQQKNAYRQHHDYFPQGSFGNHNFDPASGGTNRFATIFLYLTDVDLGGQTVFPEADPLTDDVLNQLKPNTVELLTSHKESDDVLPVLEEVFKPGTWEDTMVRLCYKKLSVKPKIGSAVLFYSMTPEWRVDPYSLHGGCPVINGTKWGANMWIWNGPRYDSINAPKTKIPPPDNGPTKLQVYFTNSFQKTGQLYWRDMLLIELGPGKSSSHNTFDTHTFRFEIDGTPVWSHTMDKARGFSQQYIIDSDTGKIHPEL